MSELWDIYDKNRKKTGKTTERNGYRLKEGEYHIVVTGIIINTKGEILISKRAEHKRHGLMWECCGGSILSGETSLEGMIREIKEELGIEFAKKDAIFLKEIRRDKTPPDFKDIWLFRKNLDIKSLTFSDGEVIEAKWVTIDEFIDMFNKNEIVPNVDFEREDYNKAIQIEQRQAYGYIEKIVEVKIDRPLNSKHPKYGFEYPVNYGYVPHTISGDGEELDCYVLGINRALDTFKGKCIAVIHRQNDDDDKLVIVPENIDFTDAEITRNTQFQEQYFESEIIR